MTKDDEFKLSLKEVKAFFDKIDLSKKFPGYINKNIFRAFMFLMLVFVLMDFYLNGFSFVSVSAACPSSALEPCENPFYECQGFEFMNCNQELPDYICDSVPCDKRFFVPGESYGRTDFLKRYGVLIIILILPVAGVVNHLVYFYKKQRGKLGG